VSDGSDMGGASSLKESFEMYRNEHRREHSHVEAAMETRLKEHQASHDREHEMREEQAREREKRLDIRLAGMNEIREQLNDQARTFMRTETATAKIEALDKSIDALSERINSLDKLLAAQAGQRGGSAATISYIMMAIGAALSILALYSFFAP
jgi:peptidoglycan hydrolase CwlO-like protein